MAKLGGVSSCVPHTLVWYMVMANSLEAGDGGPSQAEMVAQVERVREGGRRQESRRVIGEV